MRLLSFTARFPDPAPLETRRLILKRPQAADFHEWAQLRRKSAGFLQHFEPQWTSDELSRTAYRARLRRQEADINSGRGLSWFLFDKSDPAQLLGGVTISNIRRGIADCGTMGYWMGEPFAGQGYMKEAVLAVCSEVFKNHGLHRVEAATVTNNERSQRLLQGCGFQREGLARSYLKINGQWQDHILFARLENDVI